MPKGSNEGGEKQAGVTRRDLLAGAVGAAGASLLGCATPRGRTKPDARSERKGKAMKKRIVILGAGFGGLETATGLAAHTKDGHFEVTLIDKNDSFFVGFSKIDVMFGRRDEAQVRYRYADLRDSGATFVKGTVKVIDTDARSVATSAGTFAYDYLVVALGADLDLDATPGFWQSGPHEFYSMNGAARLKPVIEEFSSGKLVLGILGLPYKCPPAPYEVICQLHDRFVRKGVRDRVTMTMIIPGQQPVPNPVVSEVLTKLLADRKIDLLKGTSIGSIDAAGKKVVVGSTKVDYDCFIGIPVHVPPAVVSESKLGRGFVPVSTANLETQIPGVYAIGDVAKIPVGDIAVPKAGAFAEDAARTVVSDILLKEGLTESLTKFRAQGSCYFELGGGQVARVTADILGGDKPKMVVDGPSTDLHADKEEFESSRRDRWFDVK